MRLYSSRQVAAAAAVAVLVVVGILGTLGLIKLPGAGEAEIDSAWTGYEAAELREIPVNVRDSWTAPVHTDFTEDEKNNITIYETLNAAVVNVTAVTVQYDWFLHAVPQEGTGSGSILDQDGHVLTNHHVIKDADRVTVTLADGSEYEAEIVGADAQNDLAVIRFDPQGRALTVIALGSSADLLVGQKVLAIGNPFGLERTLTVGVVSGLGRPLRTEAGYIIRETIQTDASINPGNSGGPLMDSSGAMIGINTSIYSVSGGSIGLGFAVPVDTAKRVLPELLRYGEVRRGWIGVPVRDLVQLNQRIVDYGGLPVDEGLLVSSVPRGSAAERAGLKGGDPASRARYGRTIIAFGGDIIVGIDGEPVRSLADLFVALEDNKPGDLVDLRVVRGKSVVELSVTLERLD